MDVISTGLPSALMNLMGVCSNIVLNRLMSAYSNAAIGAVGIAKKIDMVTFATATGISQGVVPLIGYNYSSGAYTRMKKLISATFTISLSITIFTSIVLFFGAGPVVRAFINDPETVQYGRLFQRIICVSGPTLSVTLLIITIFQSVGRKVEPVILSMLRKGGLDTPFMFIMNRLIGVNGIVWATPIADYLSMIVGLILFIPFLKKLKTQIDE